MLLVVVNIYKYSIARVQGLEFSREMRDLFSQRCFGRNRQLYDLFEFVDIVDGLKYEFLAETQGVHKVGREALNKLLSYLRDPSFRGSGEVRYR